MHLPHNLIFNTKIYLDAMHLRQKMFGERQMQKNKLIAIISTAVFTILATSLWVSPAKAAVGVELTVVKSSDDSSESIGVIGGGSWTWSLVVSNTGDTNAAFTDGQTLLSDQLPTTNITYGVVSVSTTTNITNSSNISCSISAGGLLTCEASAATVTVGATTGTFEVSFTATASAAGTFTNPTGGTCSVDPNNNIVEADDTNNDCNVDAVTVAAPDLEVTNTNNVSDAADLDNAPTAWTWTFDIKNTGAGAAEFAGGETVFTTSLPNTNVTYSGESLSGETNMTGGIDCSINGSYDLICKAIVGLGLTIGGTTGKFTISITVTPSSEATYDNPRVLNGCKIDPNNNIPEDDDSNNTCSNSVAVTAPDLSVTKYDSALADSASIAVPFTWVLKVRNTGSSDAVFTNGEIILIDNLPNTNVLYSAISITNVTNMVNSGHITCSISSYNLTCSVTGAGPVTIGSVDGSFDVEITTILLSTGAFNNPRGGGICRVDPGFKITEGSELNNECSDTVTGNAADFQATKTNNVAGSTPLGSNFTWTTRVINSGAGDATLFQNTVLFVDNLPNTNIAYGAISVANVTGISGTGTISCSEAAFNITCIASGGTIIMSDSGGSYFDVIITGTPTAVGVYGNPRSGGICKADPNNAYAVESNEGNNDCSDSVTITVPDLTVSKTSPGTVYTNGTFDWVLKVTNNGSAAAVFAQNDVLLNDDMPAAASYGAPTITYTGGVVGTISCTTPAPNLNCIAALAGGLTIPAGDSITIIVPVTAPNSLGDLVNPEGGTCEVDPNDVVTEGDETNNTCTDTVTVKYPPFLNNGISHTVNNSGGSFNCGPWEILIPNGAVPDNSVLRCKPLAPSQVAPSGTGLQALGKTWDIKILDSSGNQLTTFYSTLTFCVQYDPSDLSQAGGNPENLGIAYSHKGEATWTPVPSTPSSGKICTNVDHLTIFGLFLPTLPATGFAPIANDLPIQPVEKAYTYLGQLWLEIPKIDVQMPIVGVPVSNDGWDVTWLGDNAGYLSGTAFPTWAGNTALTGHVWGANNTPGPFANLSELQHGDRFYIHAFGLVYTYEVRSTEKVYTSDLSVLGHSDYDIVTLLTCESWSFWMGEYRYRRAVQAVLMDISIE